MKNKKIKKHRTILICFIIILLILVLFVFYIKKNNQKNKIKEALEYMECKYIEIDSSDENEFDVDIFTGIAFKPVESYVHTNQAYYEQLIKILATQLKDKSFRIIDREKEIIVRVTNKNSDLKYTINGDNNYYETEMTRISINNKENEKDIILDVKSQLLNLIIENDWRRAAIKNNLGTIEKQDNNYDIYDDEGYEIRYLNLKVFNIVFKKNFNEEIFEGIKTGLTNEDIVKKIGTPTFQSDEKQEIGYKTKDFYIFFYNGEISIYRVDRFDESCNKEFASMVSNLLENNDLDSFINKVTDLYPDYDRFVQNDDGIEIEYSIRGIKISYLKNGPKGITVYSNYQGKITNNLSINDISDENTLPLNLYYSNINSVYQYELKKGY